MLLSRFFCLLILGSGLFSHADQGVNPNAKPPARIESPFNLNFAIRPPRAQILPASSIPLSISAGNIGQASPSPNILADAANRLNDKDIADDRREALGKTFFDNSQKPGSGVFAAAPPDSSWPKLPSGAQAVTTYTMRRPRDIDKALSKIDNAKPLAQKLREHAREMTPYQVHVYTDAFGAPFVAIELSNKPALADLMPDLEPHERELIKKIIARNRNVQLLIRETGKTPDLIVDGTITEMKSMSGKRHHLISSVNDALAQITAHAGRHGLTGAGEVAIYYRRENRVPAQEAALSIEAWRQGKPEIPLRKIILFSREDMRVFIRQPDGSFKLQDAPLAMDAGGLSRPWALETLRLLARAPGRAFPIQSPAFAA